VSSGVGVKDTNVLEQRFVNRVTRDGWVEVNLRCVLGREEVGHVLMRHGLCGTFGELETERLEVGHRLEGRRSCMRSALEIYKSAKVERGVGGDF